MKSRVHETFFSDDSVRELMGSALLEVAEQDELLSALLAECDGRDTRSEGIPTFIVLEDYFSKTQPMRRAAPGDEGLGILYALWLAVLAAKVEQEGKESTYPPVCPAMSALAEKFFRIAPYQDVREEKP